MSKGNLHKSLRIHIRREKARIRREIFDIKEQQKLIDELYQKHLKNKLSDSSLPEQSSAKNKQDKTDKDKKTSKQSPAKKKENKVNKTDKDKKTPKQSPAKKEEKKVNKKKVNKKKK